MKKTWKGFLLGVSICAALGALIYKGLEMFSDWHSQIQTKAWKKGWDEGFKVSERLARRDTYWDLYLSEDISWDRFQELTKE